ncbi:30S ribosomal protein S28e [Candidatus Woesearchaeota archaeon]|nr:30S ribosomal protein S28e [Candidatus Woesearchaeota archaeon]
MAKKNSSTEKTEAPVVEQRVEGGEIRFIPGIPAEVKEIVARAGSRGELTQVMCLVLDGRDKNKAIRRNVKGPVQIGDILMLLETEIEAQRLGGGRRSSGSSGSKS